MMNEFAASFVLRFENSFSKANPLNSNCVHIHNKARLTYLEAIYMNSLNLLKNPNKNPKLHWTEKLQFTNPLRLAFKDDLFLKILLH